MGGQYAPNLRFRFRGRNNYLVDTPSFAAATAAANVPLPAVEIAEDSPLLIEVVQQSGTGAAIVGTAQVTLADLRYGASHGGVVVVALHSQAVSSPIGNVQLALTR